MRRFLRNFFLEMEVILGNSEGKGKYAWKVSLEFAVGFDLDAAPKLKLGVSPK